MKTMGRQRGATLLVGMIMLVVLTLLVVFALRSSNVGLKIAGNVQAQVEAEGATQKAIETVIEQIKVEATGDLSTIVLQTVPVVVGDKTFNVTVAALSCEFERPLLTYTGELKPDDPLDQPCFGGTTTDDPPLDLDLKPIPQLSACKQQRWKIDATLTDPTTGAAVNLVQGIAARAPSTAKDCP